MRATDRWAIERARDRVARADGAGGGGARAGRRRASCRPGGSSSSAARATTAATGYVAARLLRRAGRDVDVLAVWEPQSSAATPRRSSTGCPARRRSPYDAARVEGAAGVVDALLGTGSTGAPREPFAGAIAALSERRATVVAADVPSGVDASTGEVAGDRGARGRDGDLPPREAGAVDRPGQGARRAPCTVDRHRHPGRRAWRRRRRPDPAATCCATMPRRGADSTKFSSGNVVVVGGSRGLTGAPGMSALAAMRAGAGYVTVAAPGEPRAGLRGPPARGDVRRRCPRTDGALGARRRSTRALGRRRARRRRRARARASGARTRRAALARDARPARRGAARDRRRRARTRTPGTLDALRRRRAPTVLTPHAGELGRLLEVDSAGGRPRAARHARASRRARGGDRRAQGRRHARRRPGRAAWRSRPAARPRSPRPARATSSPASPRAMLAKRLDPFHAACAAVHAAPARGPARGAEPHGPDGVIASDVIAALPGALAA